MSEEDQKKPSNTETHFSKYERIIGSGGPLLCQDFAVRGGRLWFESEEGKGSLSFR